MAHPRGQRYRSRPPGVVSKIDSHTYGRARDENRDHCSVLPLGAAFFFGGRIRSCSAYVIARSRLDSDEHNRAEGGSAFA